MWHDLGGTRLEGPWFVLVDAEGRTLAQELMHTIPNAYLVVAVADALRMTGPAPASAR